MNIYCFWKIKSQWKIQNIVMKSCMVFKSTVPRPCIFHPDRLAGPIGWVGIGSEHQEPQRGFVWGSFCLRWYRTMLSWELGLQSDQAASVTALPYRRLSLQLRTSSWISGLQTFGRKTSCYLQTELYVKHLLNKSLLSGWSRDWDWDLWSY